MGAITLIKTGRKGLESTITFKVEDGSEDVVGNTLEVNMYKGWHYVSKSDK